MGVVERYGFRNVIHAFTPSLKTSLCRKIQRDWVAQFMISSCSISQKGNNCIDLLCFGRHDSLGKWHRQSHYTSSIAPVDIKPHSIRHLFKPVIPIVLWVADWSTQRSAALNLPTVCTRTDHSKGIPIDFLPCFGLPFSRQYFAFIYDNLARYYSVFLME